MNAQGIHVQNKSNKLLLPFLAGMWSSGAVSATLISILVSKKVSLCWQVDAIALCGFLMALIGLIGSRKDLMNPREEYVAAPRITPRNILSTFRFIPYLSFGHIPFKHIFKKTSFRIIFIFFSFIYWISPSTSSRCHFCKFILRSEENGRRKCDRKIFTNP